MTAILNTLQELESYKVLLNAIKTGKLPIMATGVMDTQKIHLIAAMMENVNRPSLIVTHSELQAKEIFEDLQFFVKDKVKLYSSKDILFYNADVRSVNILKQRFDVLNSLIENDAPVVVLSAEALLDKLTPPDVFKQFILNLKIGDSLDTHEFAKKLTLMGYERAELVEAKGQFAIRGGVLDIYSSIYDNPVRIEFWDDEIDSIRLLDVVSQRSIEKLETVKIFPMRELVYPDHAVDIALEQMQKDFSKAHKKYLSKDYTEEAQTLKENFEQAYERLKEGRSFSGIERYTNYFYSEAASIIDYLPEGCMIFFDEPQKTKQHIETVLDEFNESVKSRIQKGQMLTGQMNMVFSYAEVLKKAEKFGVILLSMFAHTIKDFTVKELVSFSVKSTGTFKQRIDLLIDDLKIWCDKGYRILFLAGAKLRGQRIADEIREKGLSAQFFDEVTELQTGIVTITSGKLTRSFEYPHIRFVVITDQEIFGAEKRKPIKKKKGAKIESFTDLKIGDYVVHDTHGIGIYRGIEQITVDETVRDYLKLQYSDGGNLYIHTSQMDLIQKYIGGEDIKVKVNKLGGGEWVKTKAKAKKVVQEMAGELIELYAKRQSAKGYSFSPDTVWQREFEDMVPFEETDDQMNAIEEVKQDMESEKVMDRLICGDVGYGKTEVAIRAAFKAVQDGKQVAFLVPTTILAQQHYNTFVQRMKDFPINICMMSRFRTNKSNKESGFEIESGRLDIVIGTHKILGKDVHFKNLGLVIIDEEQRFGVAHKEKLKHLKENVDVMTLTATPIPRTLHMSLTGIRDMSVLEEPPQERQPIQTYVMEYEAELVREAINREVARGGQVYYLHNRVHNISETAAKIQKLVPSVSVSYAHGQMNERELESAMMDFIEGNIQVLVCTTIIETGLDISNVNTIIIEDADTMGLSQLYQLRGRVGRSNRLAYAYLMYRKNKVLHEIAEKRLQTIRDFTEFGSGFKIAMRDLEIRGAGNMLGGEQHGHIEAVGYEMYCRLLSEALHEMRGEAVAESFETSIDININAFIPTYYIKNEEQKLEIYKKISLITGDRDFYDVQEEIEDRYGNLPDCVQNLLNISVLKAYAHKIGVLSVTQKEQKIVLVFKPDAKVDPVTILNLVDANKDILTFSLRQSPTLIYTIKENLKQSPVTHLKMLITSIKE